MSALGDSLRVLMGRQFRGDELVAMFSIRLDETGTDGRSPYTVVGGAVATLAQWERLEEEWGRLLATYKVSAFHTKEFDERSGDFEGWNAFKVERFSKRQAKICSRHTTFRVCAGLDRAVHADVKRKMRGIKGFHPDSDYSLCLRYILFAASERISRELADDFRITVMLEAGPYASGAVALYGRLSKMTRSWKPARHAHRLAGISVLPKGERLSLEAADYLVGVAGKRALAGRFNRADGAQESILMNRNFLERWYKGMIDEKEHRRVFGQRAPRRDKLSMDHT